MKNKAQNKPIFDVFLSHNSKDKPAVRALAALLKERDIKVWLDENQLIPGRPWQPLLEKGIKESSTGAVLVGADGLGPWEDEEMQALLNLAVREKKPVIPVLLPGAPRKPDLPLFLSNRTWVDLRAGFEKESIDKLIWGITGKKPDSTSTVQPEPGLKIAVTRLRHGAERLVGREKELARLETAWHDPKTHVVTIVAWGGVGKTALVVDWMARMAHDDWRGAERIFDWSFYSQGTSETTTASADAFVAKALEFFGDSEMAQSAASPWDKGERLARFVAERKTLLVLDGVEPLQHPPGPVGGKLKDLALGTLLKGLAQYNAGLCLVTTRESLTDLAPFHQTTAPEWSLEHLSEEAGAQLLFDTGVKRAGDADIQADDQELKDAVREVDGHALTLQLLGPYLHKCYNGDVRKRSLVAFEKADTKVHGGHAFRVMAAYEKWLGDTGEEGKRQLAILQLVSLGLFDRPADPSCIVALREEPAIEGLTEPLIGLDDDDWGYTLSNLCECGLIATYANESTINAHPLLKEYFAKQIREKKPNTRRELHRRLYEHLIQSTEYRPDTLAGLQPLYQAVVYACQAGIHKEAFEDVYRDRILRGTGPNGFYSTRKLGALGSDLAAVACFFEKPWSEVSPQLSEADEAWLLNEAAVFLRALGRLTEALEPMRAGLDMSVRQEDWINATIRTGNLSELELTLGQVDDAMTDGKKILTFADRSGEWGVHQMYRASYANALHQAGKQAEATEKFQQFEAMQAEHQPEYPLLYSLRGFRYCDLILAPVERATWQLLINPKSESLNLKLLEACHDVEQRAEKMFEWRAPNDSLLDIALDHLSLGSVLLYEAILKESRPKASGSRLVEVASHLGEAMEGLHCAGQLDHLPRGLLARALLRFVEGDADGCRADLDEAWQIAERGSMRLFMADVLLHRTRLFRDKAALAEARELIEQCGYHRRDGELTDAEEAAKVW